MQIYLREGMIAADDRDAPLAQILCELVGPKIKGTGALDRAEERDGFAAEEVEFAERGGLGGASLPRCSLSADG